MKNVIALEEFADNLAEFLDQVTFEVWNDVSEVEKPLEGKILLEPGGEGWVEVRIEMPEGKVMEFTIDAYGKTGVEMGGIFYI